MDFHLQSSKMERSHGCGTRAEPHSKSKKQEEDRKCVLGALISLLFLHHMVPSPAEFLTEPDPQDNQGCEGPLEVQPLLGAGLPSTSDQVAWSCVQLSQHITLHNYT